MRCNSCGNTIRLENGYCPICGYNLDEQKIEEFIVKDKKNTFFKRTMFIFVCLLIVICIYYYIVGLNSDLSVKGSWECADYINNMSINDESLYYFSFNFLDKDFVLSSNSKASNKFYLSGNYKEHLSKKTSNYARGYINVVLNTKIDKKQSHYEFGILSNKSLALVINTDNYLVYFCKKD